MLKKGKNALPAVPACLFKDEGGVLNFKACGPASEAETWMGVHRQAVGADQVQTRKQWEKRQRFRTETLCGGSVISAASPFCTGTCEINSNQAGRSHKKMWPR